MSNAMTTFNSNNLPSFKSEELTNYTKQIAAIGDKVSESQVELAKILGAVKTTACYKEDGFDSVADYAEKTFGLARSYTYQLAKVGERFYNKETETTKTVSALLTPSNLAEIVNMSDEQIEKELENGTISEASTQKSLREVAAHNKEPKAVKVEATFDIDAVITEFIKDGVTTSRVTAENVIKPNFADELGFPENASITPVKLDNESELKVKHLFITDPYGLRWAYISYLPHKKPKATKEARKPKLTKDELLALLAEYENEDE